MPDDTPIPPLVTRADIKRRRWIGQDDAGNRLELIDRGGYVIVSLDDPNARQVAYIALSPVDALELGRFLQAVCVERSAPRLPTAAVVRAGQPGADKLVPEVANPTDVDKR